MGTYFGIPTDSVALLNYDQGKANGSILAKSGSGYLQGIFVSKVDGPGTGAGSLMVYDSAGTSTGSLVDQFPVANATFYNFGNLAYSTGLYVVAYGSVKASVFYN